MMIRACLVLLLAIAAPAHASPAEQVTMLVKVRRWIQRGVPCGTQHSIGEAEYDVVRVESGAFAAHELAVEISCPVDSGVVPLNGVFRISVTARRPDWPTIPKRSLLPERRYLVMSQALFPEVLGMASAKLDGLFPQTGETDGWLQHGELSVKLENGTVRRMRISVEARRRLELWYWGFRKAGDPDQRFADGQGWSGRPGHAIAPGVAGARHGTTLELWLTP